MAVRQVRWREVNYRGSRRFVVSKDSEVVEVQDEERQQDNMNDSISEEPDNRDVDDEVLYVSDFSV